jgi:hypothetical protein
MRMKVIVTLLVAGFLHTAAYAGTDYRKNFASFKIGDNKEAYCTPILKKKGILEECLHQLVIYERTLNTCATRYDEKRCLALNMNLWERFALDKTSIRKDLAFFSKTKVDMVALNKILLEDAANFSIQCPGVSSKGYASCESAQAPVIE